MAVDATNARFFWIESDPLSGGSSSQVEFPLEVGPFFGQSSTPQLLDETSIAVQSAGVSFPPKKLDCHHNDVWRLNLPTERQGLGPYGDTIVCFERTEDPAVFQLTVVPSSSARSRTRQASACPIQPHECALPIRPTTTQCRIQTCQTSSMCG